MTPGNLHWYVATVKSCQERRTAEALALMGVEHYLPVQKVKRRWSDRIKVVDQLVLPRMIFIRTDNVTRVKLLSQIYGLSRYLSNGGPFNPVVVPDDQMESFMYMVSRSSGEVSVRRDQLAPGDQVKVVDGPLAGMTCELLSFSGKNYIAVRLEFLGAATTEISIDSVVKVL